MDWSDPVNDIIPNDKHEDNTLLPSNREAKKVFFKPNSWWLYFHRSQPTETENTEFHIAYDDSQLMMCIWDLKHGTQLNFVKQIKQKLTNGSSIMSTLKLKMSDKYVSLEDGYVLVR